MKDINIKESDILWKLYVLYFTLKGIPLEQPKNLCNYFQTAVMGFLLWPLERLNLWLISGIAAASVVLGFVTRYSHGMLVGESEPRWLIELEYHIHDVLLLIFMLSSFLALTVSYHRFDKWARDHKKAVAIITVPIAVAMCIYGLALDSRENWKDVKEMGLFFMIMICVAIGFLALLTVAVTIWQKSPPERQGKMQRFFSTLASWLAARKRGFCPLVQAPEGQVPDPQDQIAQADQVVQKS